MPVKNEKAKITAGAITAVRGTAVARVPTDSSARAGTPAGGNAIRRWKHGDTA